MNKNPMASEKLQTKTKADRDMKKSLVNAYQIGYTVVRPDCWEGNYAEEV